MAKGIYCYIDKKDNQIVYVGKDSNIDKNKRRRQHLTPSRYNAQPINCILQNNPDRYTYQVLVWSVEDENTLNALEIQYIRQLQPRFNFTEGGDGMSGFRHSEETRKKMSEARKGENHPMYGKTHSEETRKKMSESQKGENNPMYGKTLSEKTRKKISESQNTTGFYRVTKQKDNNCKQGFTWRYQYPYKSTRKTISSTDLKKLEKKVRKEGLEWKIINEKRAQKSLEENNRYRTNNKRKCLSSTSLKTLEKRVRENNLKWQIVNNEKAKQSILLDGCDI